MALTLRTINNSGAGLKDPAGNPLTNTEVTFTLCDRYGKPCDFFDSVTGERVASVPQTVTTDSNAEFTVSLWPTSRATETSFYKCAVNYTGIKDFIAPLVEGDSALSWATFKASGATLSPSDISSFTLHVQDRTLHITSPQNYALDAANNPSGSNPFATINDITIAGGGHIIQDEGVNAPAEPRLNFVGSGVQVSDDPANSATVVTINTGATNNATNVVEGVVKLSVAPTDPDNPIAVGTNDNRLSDARTPLSHSQQLATISDVNITAANLNSLDDGTNSILHFHNSDRDRANHSGTQAWNTVSKTGAQLTDIPDIPPTVANRTLKRNASNTGYEWADISGLSDHEGLTGLQGGATGDHKHLTTAQLNTVTNTSGTNTGDQNTFSTVSVSGQSNVVADSTADTLTLVGGTGISITTNPISDAITITATGSATPGAHATSHVTGGSDVIPSAVANGNAGLLTGVDKAKLDSLTVISSATDVPYSNTTYTTVASALDKLLYVAPSITSFTLSVGTVEVGSTVTAVNANWAYNKTMATASLTDATINASQTSHNFTGLNITIDKTYTLTCGDGTNTASSSRTVTFSHKRYWGTSTNASLTNAQILALSSEFSSSKSKSVTYDCTGGKYFYFCYPQSWGSPTVTVGGLSFTDFTVTAQAFTNASGNTTTFNIIRCNSLQTGSAINVVWS